MKAKDIIVGRTYMAKVSGVICPVRVLGMSRYGGWDAMNTKTGRTIHVRGPQRFRYEVRRETGGATARPAESTPSRPGGPPSPPPPQG